METRLRVVLWAQHLSGVGHYVRTFEIARALAAAHDVWIVEGGRPVPRPPVPEIINRIELPRIIRGPDGIAALDGRPPGETLRQRREILEREISGIRPDLLVIEHFPFSKWELGEEYLAGVEAVRRANPSARIVCSLRDVVLRTRHEAAGENEYAARVTALLEKFDAVMVHGDPAISRLEDFFSAALPVSVHYTGIVSEKPREPEGMTLRRIQEQRPFVLVSIGGGAGDESFVDHCIAAWMDLVEDNSVRQRRMLIFEGLGWDAERRARLRRQLRGARIAAQPFTADFLSWMAAADLAITHAGYNTCANILETGVPALLVPDPNMSDQAARAAALARLGVAHTLDAGTLSTATVKDTILRALQRGRTASAHGIRLDGAAATRQYLESLTGRS